MKRLALLFIATVSIVNGAAYKLPEQSIAGMALSAANVASCEGADCAYYNPANISFLDPSTQFIELGATFVHLPSIKFKGTQTIPNIGTVNADGKTKTENIPIPYAHYVSKAYGPWRYSVSVVVPVGLSKKWNTPVQKLYAQEFTLKTIMLNPSIAYKINNNFAVAVGLNIIYSEGKVYSDGSKIGLPLKRQMKGTSTDYGYNIAAALHLDNGINLALTYRSKIKLSEKGNANLYFANLGERYKAYVDIYNPAALSLAISKNFDKFTLEFVYERTFWSSYKKLDFNYDRAILPILRDSFDKPKDKFWKDTNSFRLGLKYRYNDKLTLMAGYSYDQSPIPTKYLSYELPDSNAHIFSGGFKYRYSKNLTLGAAVLYDYKKSRKVSANINGISGKFTKGGALLFTSGFEYKF